ncbi:S-adenosyl-L-methionine-dependent methyltransferase [Fennellomyces sp. T-0311]|nr:S-adenosyl-L-methionine-dependent methyltransferase [Fennellomyces sp. T-0311]
MGISLSKDDKSSSSSKKKGSRLPSRLKTDDNPIRATALKALKEKQQQQKKNRQHHHVTLPTSPITPVPVHRPLKPNYSNASTPSSSRSSNHTNPSSAQSGSSFQDMSLEERLQALNLLPGGAKLPTVERTSYGHFDNGDEQEYNRQLRLHYVLKQVMSGNVQVEFDEPPSMILDCACGAGFWSLDMGQAYPESHVVALDLALPEDAHLREDNTKMGLAADGTPNVTYMHGDILALPLPFGDNTFDFVYQREMGTVIPNKHWPSLISEFYRILKSGGTIQLVEYPLEFPSCGPLSEVVNSWVQTESVKHGLDVNFIDSFEGYLDDAGFEEIQTQVYEFPVGEWPKNDRDRQQGFLQKDITRLLLKQMKPLLGKALEMSSDQYDQFSAAVMNEFEEKHGTTLWKVLTARKTT